jgi:pseudouridine synthase
MRAIRGAIEQVILPDQQKDLVRMFGVVAQRLRERYQEIKKDIERRVEGIRTSLTQLKSRFSPDNIDAAKKRLDELRQEVLTIPSLPAQENLRQEIAVAEQGMDDARKEYDHVLAQQKIIDEIRPRLETCINTVANWQVTGRDGMLNTGVTPEGLAEEGFELLRQLDLRVEAAKKFFNETSGRLSLAINRKRQALDAAKGERDAARQRARAEAEEKALAYLARCEDEIAQASGGQLKVLKGKIENLPAAILQSLDPEQRRSVQEEQQALLAKVTAAFTAKKEAAQPVAQLREITPGDRERIIALKDKFPKRLGQLNAAMGEMLNARAQGNEAGVKKAQDRVAAILVQLNDVHPADLAVYQEALQFKPETGSASSTKALLLEPFSLLLLGELFSLPGLWPGLALTALVVLTVFLLWRVSREWLLPLGISFAVVLAIVFFLASYGPQLAGLLHIGKVSPLAQADIFWLLPQWAAHQPILYGWVLALAGMVAGREGVAPDYAISKVILERLRENLRRSLEGQGKFMLTPFIVWEALEKIGFAKIKAMSVAQFAQELAGGLDVGLAINNAGNRKEARERFASAFRRPIYETDVILHTMLNAAAVSYEDIELSHGLYDVYGSRISAVLVALGIKGYVRVVSIFNQDILEQKSAWEKHLILHDLSEAVAIRMSEVDDSFAEDTRHASPAILKLQFLFSYVMGGPAEVGRAVNTQRELNRTKKFKAAPAVEALEKIFRLASTGELFSDLGIPAWGAKDASEARAGPACGLGSDVSMPDSGPGGSGLRCDFPQEPRQSEELPEDDQGLRMVGSGEIAVLDYANLGGGLTYIYKVLFEGQARILKFARESRHDIIVPQAEMLHQINPQGMINALPHVVALTEVFAGRPGMLLEVFPAGTRLDDYVKKQGYLSEAAALDIAIQIARLLKDHVHAHNIIHRDVKPTNILMLDAGGLLLFDFDIAVYKNYDWQRDPRTIKAIRSVLYVPDDIENQSAQPDFSDDCFALGLDILFMLYGHDVLSLYPGIFDRISSPGLKDIIVRALHPDRARRYHVIGEMLADLEGCRADMKPDIRGPATDAEQGLPRNSFGLGCDYPVGRSRTTDGSEGEPKGVEGNGLEKSHRKSAAELRKKLTNVQRIDRVEAIIKEVNRILDEAGIEIEEVRAYWLVRERAYAKLIDLLEHLSKTTDNQAVFKDILERLRVLGGLTDTGGEHLLSGGQLAACDRIIKAISTELAKLDAKPCRADQLPGCRSRHDLRLKRETFGGERGSAPRQVGGHWPVMVPFYNRAEEIFRPYVGWVVARIIAQVFLPVVEMLVPICGSLLLLWEFGLPLSLAPPVAVLITCIVLWLSLFVPFWHLPHIRGAEKKGLKDKLALVFSLEKLLISIPTVLIIALGFQLGLPAWLTFLLALPADITVNTVCAFSVYPFKTMRLDYPAIELAKLWNEHECRRLGNQVVGELMNKFGEGSYEFRDDLRFGEQSYSYEEYCKSSAQVFYMDEIPPGLCFIRVGFFFFLDKEAYSGLSEPLRKTLSSNVILVDDFKHSTIAEPILGPYTMAAIIAMINSDISGKRVIDAGSAEGILAFIAMKLGATSVDLIDKESQLLERASKFLELNELKREVHYRLHCGNLKNTKRIARRIPRVKEETAVVSDIGSWRELYDITNQESIALANAISNTTLFVGAGYHEGKSEAMLKDQDVVRKSRFCINPVYAKKGGQILYILAWIGTRQIRDGFIFLDGSAGGAGRSRAQRRSSRLHFPKGTIGSLGLLGILVVMALFGFFALPYLAQANVFWLLPLAGMVGGGGKASVKSMLIRRIRQKGRITFAEFMEISLYSPNGYYARKAKIGQMQDFWTYPNEFSPDYGENLAKQLVQMWEIMGRPARFQVVEQGAGYGIMVRDILIALRVIRPELFANLEYVILEISPEMRRKQEALLDGQGFPVRWIAGSAIEMSQELEGVEGAFLANELVDTFPVHRVKLDLKLGWCELYIGWDGRRFTEEWDSLSSGEIGNYMETFIQAREAKRAQFLYLLINHELAVNLNAIRWQKAIDQRLKRGYALTIDYSFYGDEEFPSADGGRAVRVYGKNKQYEDMFKCPGEVDITSVFDIRTVLEICKTSNLNNIGLTDIIRFFFKLGMKIDLCHAMKQSFVKLKNVPHYVLIQGKGVPPEAELMGLSKGRQEPIRRNDSGWGEAQRKPTHNQKQSPAARPANRDRPRRKPGIRRDTHRADNPGGAEGSAPAAAGPGLGCPEGDGKAQSGATPAGRGGTRQGLSGLPVREFKFLLYPGCGIDVKTVIELTEFLSAVEVVHLIDNCQQYSFEQIKEIFIRQFRESSSFDDITDTGFIPQGDQKDVLMFHCKRAGTTKPVGVYFHQYDFLKIDKIRWLEQGACITLAKLPGEAGSLTWLTNTLFWGQIYAHTKGYVFVDGSVWPPQDEVTASCFEQVVCRGLPVWVDRVYRAKTDGNVIATLRSQLLRFLARSASPRSDNDIVDRMPLFSGSAVSHMRAMVEIGLVVERDTGARSLYCLSLEARTQHAYPFENLLRRIEVERVDELECREVRAELYELCRHAADMFGDILINILISLNRSISKLPWASLGSNRVSVVALESLYRMIGDRKEEFVRQSRAFNLLGYRGSKEQLSALSISDLFTELVSAYRIISEIREAAQEVAKNDFSKIEERVNVLLFVMLCQLDHFLWVIKPIAQKAEEKLGIKGFYMRTRTANGDVPQRDTPRAKNPAGGAGRSSAPGQAASQNHRRHFPKGTLGVIPLLGILFSFAVVLAAVFFLAPYWPQLADLLNIGKAAPAQGAASLWPLFGPLAVGAILNGKTGAGGEERNGLSSSVIEEISLKGDDNIFQSKRAEIIRRMKEAHLRRYFLIIHKEIDDEKGNKIFKHEIYELRRKKNESSVRALVWRDTLAGLEKNDLPKDSAELLDYISDAKGIPVIEPDKPIILSEGVLSKAWGAEIPFTMIEGRYVADVTDARGTKKSKLPDVLKLFPGSFGVDPEKNLVLLKLLKPGSQPRVSDLYLEVHWEKYELYVVTAIDENAWPEGKARIVCGLNAQLVAEYKARYGEAWREKYKQDFRAASDRYKDEIYEEYTSKAPKDKSFNDVIDKPEKTLRDEIERKEIALRDAVYNFAGYKEVSVGDVLVFPRGTVHSLRHGIEVAEVLSFHYERGILVPTLQPVTSFEGIWFTDTAFAVMEMSAYAPAEFKTVGGIPGQYAIEHLATFPLRNQYFTTERISLEKDAGICDNTVSANSGKSYHLLMAIKGSLEISSPSGWKVELATKKAVIIPANNGSYTVKSSGGQPAVYLKMFVTSEEARMSATAKGLTAEALYDFDRHELNVRLLERLVDQAGRNAEFVLEERIIARIVGGTRVLRSGRREDIDIALILPDDFLSGECSEFIKQLKQVVEEYQGVKLKKREVNKKEGRHFPVNYLEITSSSTAQVKEIDIRDIFLIPDPRYILNALDFCSQVLEDQTPESLSHLSFKNLITLEYYLGDLKIYNEMLKEFKAEVQDSGDTIIDFKQHPSYAERAKVHIAQAKRLMECDERKLAGDEKFIQMYTRYTQFIFRDDADCGPDSSPDTDGKEGKAISSDKKRGAENSASGLESNAASCFAFLGLGMTRPEWMLIGLALVVIFLCIAPLIRSDRGGTKIKPIAAPGFLSVLAGAVLAGFLFWPQIIKVADVLFEVFIARVPLPDEFLQLPKENIRLAVIFAFIAAAVIIITAARELIAIFMGYSNRGIRRPSSRNTLLILAATSAIGLAVFFWPQIQQPANALFAAAAPLELANMLYFLPLAGMVAGGGSDNEGAAPQGQGKDEIKKWVRVNWEPRVALVLMFLQHPSLPKVRFNKRARSFEVRWIHGVRMSAWPYQATGLSDEEFVKQIILWSLQISEAVQLLHDQGIEHGDLTPSNVILETGSLNPVLTDFSDYYRPDFESAGSLIVVSLLTRATVSLWQRGIASVTANEILDEMHRRFDPELLALGWRKDYTSMKEFSAALEDYYRRKFGKRADEVSKSCDNGRPNDNAHVSTQLPKPARPIIMMHKPVGYITSTKTDPHNPGVPTVMGLLPDRFQGLKPIGRLDMDTSGVLLFGRGGKLVQYLLNPAWADSDEKRVCKTYEALVEGCLSDADKEKLLAGFEITVLKKRKSSSHFARARSVRVISRNEKQSTVEVVITEGKYHQVRSMLAGVGHPVITLQRIAFGEIKLGDLPVGAVRELTEAEYAWVAAVCARKQARQSLRRGTSVAGNPTLLQGEGGRNGKVPDKKINKLIILAKMTGRWMSSLPNKDLLVQECFGRAVVASLLGEDGKALYSERLNESWAEVVVEGDSFLIDLWVPEEMRESVRPWLVDNMAIMPLDAARQIYGWGQEIGFKHSRAWEIVRSILLGEGWESSIGVDHETDLQVRGLLRETLLEKLAARRSCIDIDKEKLKNRGSDHYKANGDGPQGAIPQTENAGDAEAEGIDAEKRE